MKPAPLLQFQVPNLNVDKNVKVGTNLAGNRDYREIIEAVGLGEKLDKMPSELSGGEQQRASIARALAKKPKVMFLGEPTGALGLTTVVMLLFYVKHYIDTHKPELGILKALGYSNWKIAKGFWVFGLSVFTGTAIGFGLAFAFMPMFYREQRNDGILPDVSIHFNPILLVYLIILPALVFSVLAVWYSYRKLKCPALELIRGKNKAKIRKSKTAGKDKTDAPFLKVNIPKLCKYYESCTPEKLGN